MMWGKQNDTAFTILRTSQGEHYQFWVANYESIPLPLLSGPCVHPGWAKG